MIVNSYTFRSFAMVLLLAAPFAMAEGQSQINLPSNAAADILSQLDTLQRQVRDLTGQLEEQQHELSQMKAQQRDRYVDLDKRVSMLMASSAQKTASAPATPIATDDEPTSIDTSSTGDVPSATTPTSTVQLAPIALKPVTPEAQQAYNDAYQLIRERQFETAEVSFTEFVKDFPDNQLTGNGFYWLGELKLVLGKPKEAIEQFNTVIKKFPGHNKEPDALYKLGIVNDQIGNTDQSKAYLQQVIRRFPDSKAAKLATSYLSKSK